MKVAGGCRVPGWAGLALLGCWSKASPAPGCEAFASSFSDSQNVLERLNFPPCYPSGTGGVTGLSLSDV